jgi:solute carrier family 7 (L-type amino acid transporter), member 8
VIFEFFRQRIAEIHDFFFFQLSIGASVLCLPWLRWAQPNLPRPIRVNLAFPVVYLIATLFVTIVPMYASPRDTGYGILMILTSVPVYGLFIAWRNKPKWFIRMMGKWTDPFRVGWGGHKPTHKHNFVILKTHIVFLGGFTQTLQKLMMVVRPKGTAKVFILFLFPFFKLARSRF